MAIEINRGIEPFEDQTDFTRGNKDRKPWGKSESSASLHLGSEYDTPPPTAPAPTQQPGPPAPPPEPAKFTHKMANGTVLEAATVEELASQIEKALVQTPAPAPVDFEDKPAYQPYEFKPKDLSMQEQADILNIWKENPQKAMRLLQEADLGAPAAVVIQKLQETQTVLRMKAEEEAAAEFLMNEETFAATKANGAKLTEYLKAKGKPITSRNFSVAFHQLVAAGDKTLLRKVEDPAPPAPDPTLEEVPPPPVLVPSNLGRPEAPTAPTVDAAKFASLSLTEQQNFFKRVKRGA
jgi:hypothetical protein